MKNKFKSLILIAASFVYVIYWSLDSVAGSLEKVKGSKTLIQLQGQSVKVGEQYFGINSAGKKKAVIKILQVKGDRAVGEIIRGKAEDGFALSEFPVPGQNTAETNEAAPSESPKKKKKRRHTEYTGNSWGILGEYLMSTMNVDFKATSASPTTTAAMKGNTFGLLGFYDYPMSPEFQLRAMGGVEQLAVSGTISEASCKSSTTCSVSITYLSGYIGGKYNLLMNQSMRVWVAGYLGLLIALSKSSNVLEESQISTNQVYVASLGMDYSLGEDTFIPIALDYGLFPSTATVKSNILYIRAGWGKSF